MHKRKGGEAINTWAIIMNQLQQSRMQAIYERKLIHINKLLSVIIFGQRPPRLPNKAYKKTTIN